ncbi:hypothetical protein FHH43_13560 [Clostridium perfringens]|nr:hypothetical protein [Clostridium perfringens]
MINLSDNGSILINNGRVDLLEFNRLSLENKEYLRDLLKRLMEESNYDSSYLKLLSLISMHIILIQDNGKAFENYCNTVKEIGVLKIRDFKILFNNSIRLKKYIKRSKFEKIINNKDKSILAYTTRYNNKDLLIVCNLLNRGNLFSFDCCEEINPSILISNYKNSEIEIDELGLRAYESIIYEF